MKKPKNEHGGAGRGQGRKPLAEGEESVVINFRGTKTQRDKFRRLGGGEWVRPLIDSAKEPK